jgi:hypothetical protein
MLGREGRRLFDGTPEGYGRGGPAPSSLLATCPECGDVVVDVVGTRVRRGPDPAVCRYAFECPSCRQPVEIAAPAHLAPVLLCLGATESPEIAELREQHDLRDGRPITLDDVLDLVLALDDEDDVVGLAERARRD